MLGLPLQYFKNKGCSKIQGNINLTSSNCNETKNSETRRRNLESTPGKENSGKGREKARDFQLRKVLNRSMESAHYKR